MAEAPRNMQLPSGYDEEFLYAVEDDFICLIVICCWRSQFLQDVVTDFAMHASRNIWEGTNKWLNS